jgi:hypothetical protein
MTRMEKAIYNRGRMGGIADAIKRLSEEGSMGLELVCPSLADEMCKAGDDLFSLFEAAEASLCTVSPTLRQA